MTETRNIILFGRTGSGKSTLGNILINRNGNFEEVFKESEKSISQTKDIQVETFKVDLDGKTIVYRVIDLIGIGDTKLSPETVLYRLAMFAKEVKEHGINRIIFASSGRFTEPEATAYRLLSSIIFDQEVYGHTTITRTKFANFRNKDKCREDIQVLRNQGQKDTFTEISKIAGDSIIHVNGSPLEEDENLKNRKTSREILMAHLLIKEEVYRPKNIDSINDRITASIEKEKEEKAKLEKQIKDLQDQLKKFKEDKVSDQKKLVKLQKDLEQLEINKKKQIDDLKKELKEGKQSQVNIQNGLDEEIRKRKKEIDDLKADFKAKERRRDEEQRQMEGRISNLQTSAATMVRNAAAEAMRGHIENNLRKGKDVIPQFATTGANIGSVAFPIIGPAVGSIIGTAVGLVVYFTEALR